MLFRKKIETDDRVVERTFWGEDYGLARVLYFDRKFRRLAAAVAAACLAVAILLPKIWPVSSPGSQNVIKISLLDKLQAMRTLRQFDKLIAEGRTEAAMKSLSRAHGYNPGDPEPSIHCLAWHAAHPNPSPAVDQWLGFESRYLQRITGTNDSTVRQIAAVFAPVDSDTAVIGTLFPLNTRLTPPERTRLLRACLFQGRFDLFDAAASAGLDASLPEIQLAKRIREVRRGTKKDQRSVIEEAKSTSKALGSPAVASRYLLAAAMAEDSQDSCEIALEQLRDGHTIKIGDETIYWSYLLEKGRRSTVLNLAKFRLAGQCAPPEAEALARAAAAMGLTDETLQFLDRELTLDPQLYDLRLAQSEILISFGRWKELSENAIKIRNTITTEQARSLAYMVEATAFAQQNQAGQASRSLSRVETKGLEPATLVLNCAQRLAVLGLEKEMGDLLVQLREEYWMLPEYWDTLQLAASRMNNATTVIDAAVEMYKKHPESAAVAGGYGSALALARRDPAKALDLTATALKEYPGSASAGLARASALAQLHRWEESQAGLDRLDAKAAAPEYIAVLEATRVECLAGTGNNARAAELARQIAATNLPPIQRAWLAEAQRKMAAAGLSK